MKREYLVSHELLNQLAYCREDDILPRLMACMRRRVPEGVEGFYIMTAEGPKLLSFAEIFSEFETNESA